ncbi:endonuclease/exonuclease/phosphatase family protein [Lacinutrix undariae]
MTHPLRYVFLILLTVLLSCKAIAFGKVSKDTLQTLKIASWNIRDLGRTKDADEITEIAKIIRDYDVVAIQEVVAKDPAGAQAVAKIADALNRMGSKWDYRISVPTQSPSVYISERYAFLWKTSKVALKSRAYLDDSLAEVIYREPFIAEFVLKNDPIPFYVVNFHSRKFNDHPEVEITYLKTYAEKFNSTRVFVLGDFNLKMAHPVWEQLYNVGFKPALKEVKTTLKTTCKLGNYLNYAIDNILYIPTHTKLLSSGSKDFVTNCEQLEHARQLSDHLPVFIECTFY